MRTHVILPVRQELFDELSAEIRARGQPDRIGYQKLDLSDVVLEVLPDRRYFRIEEQGALHK